MITKSETTPQTKGTGQTYERDAKGRLWTTIDGIRIQLPNGAVVPDAGDGPKLVDASHRYVKPTTVPMSVHFVPVGINATTGAHSEPLSLGGLDWRECLWFALNHGWQMAGPLVLKLEQRGASRKGSELTLGGPVLMPGERLPADPASYCRIRIRIESEDCRALAQAIAPLSRGVVGQLGALLRTAADAGGIDLL